MWCDWIMLKKSIESGCISFVPIFIISIWKRAAKFANKFQIVSEKQDDLYGGVNDRNMRKSVGAKCIILLEWKTKNTCKFSISMNSVHSTDQITWEYLEQMNVSHISPSDELTSFNFISFTQEDKRIKERIRKKRVYLISLGGWLTFNHFICSHSFLSPKSLHFKRIPLNWAHSIYSGSHFFLSSISFQANEGSQKKKKTQNKTKN